MLELLRSGAWLVLLLELLRPLLDRSIRSKGLYIGFGLYMIGLLSVELLGLSPDDGRLRMQLIMLGHVGLALVGLILIEHLFRNTKPEQRWATKFLYFAIGTLFAYDFFLYTDALLLYQIDIQIWSARGLVSAMTVPLIAMAAVRNPQWSLEIFVSRRIVVHSVAIIGSGLYLLAMAGWRLCCSPGTCARP